MQRVIMFIRPLLGLLVLLSDLLSLQNLLGRVKCSGEGLGSRPHPSTSNNAALSLSRCLVLPQDSMCINTRRTFDVRRRQETPGRRQVELCSRRPSINLLFVRSADCAGLVRMRTRKLNVQVSLGLKQAAGVSTAPLNSGRTGGLKASCPPDLPSSSPDNLPPPPSTDTQVNLINPPWICTA